MKRKLLVINCDDFGQSPAMNAAIMHLLEEGLVSSATIMAPAPAFREAAEWCRKREQPNIGLHLTLTSEFDALRFPSLTGAGSLHDETGNLYRTVEEFERGADTRDVMRELTAQYEKVRASGVPITHADNHMGSLYGMATGRSHIPHVLRWCARRGLPFRLFRKVDPSDPLLGPMPGVERSAAKASALAGVLGVALPDYLLSHPFEKREGETYDSFKRMMIDKLYRLPDGICETYIHPGIDDPWMRERIPHWEKRVWEFQLMMDDDFRYAIRDAGVMLVDYRHIRRRGRESRLRAGMRLLAAALGR